MMLREEPRHNQALHRDAVNRARERKFKIQGDGTQRWM
jgi:hypothetical protein